jgi:site-specific DNA-methyltransferase (adenine-specific)
MPELTLFHGDCLQVMKEIPDKSVDLIICDLPYGCLTGGGITKKETAEKYGRKGTEGISGCVWDIKINLEDFWKEVRRIRKSEHTPTIHFCTTKFGYELIQSNEAEFRYDLVWDKQRGVSFLTANKMPMRSHEMIYVFSKAGAFYERKDIEGNFQSWKVKREGQTTNCYGGAKKNNTEGGNGKRCALSIIQMDGHLSRHKNQHPTEKPCELYKFLIERYCPAGGTILDPTFGSGNSVFTAYKLGRNAIGIEKDEKFFEKAVKILEAL